MSNPFWQPWHERARCLDADPSIFFHDGDDTKDHARTHNRNVITQWCEPCPVRAQCLAFTLRSEPVNTPSGGVAGGMTGRQRRQLPADVRAELIKAGAA